VLTRSPSKLKIATEMKLFTGTLYLIVVAGLNGFGKFCSSEKVPGT
jgi:hypothetical protein